MFDWSRLVLRIAVASAALFSIAAALLRIHAASVGVDVTSIEINGTPVTVFRPASGPVGPVVLIAHGFAGSQQLMQSFALTFARNGYAAVTFDFLGHGRNAAPLTGSIVEASGATRALVDQTALIATFARGLGDGRMAVLGHSMASDIVIRFAEATPEIGATIAVSMFSPAVTATAPANLLVIVGGWEGTLKREALRAVGLAIAPEAARPGVTYGDLAEGTGRRAAFSAYVEHASVLFSEDSMREAVAWLDQAFGKVRPGAPVLDQRGPWLLILMAGIVALAWPLSSLLPRIADPPAGAGLPWRKLAPALLVPTLATPLLLRVLPTHFLPVLVVDYLAAHFAVYGLIAALCIFWARRSGPVQSPRPISIVRFVVATAAMIAFGFVALVWPIDRFVTSFIPGPARIALVAVLFAGTLSYFLSDEWLTHGETSARGAAALSRIAFLVSLGIAVGLDFQRLFFLIVILPVIVLLFVVYGLLSAWSYRSTGHPFVAGIASAVAFAWAMGVTFPLLSG